MKVADAWWKVAEPTGPAPPVVRQRVLDLYTQIEPAVTKPITKGVVKKRMDELKASLTTAAPAPVVRKLVPKPKQDENELPVGEPIDLLAMVKLPEHAIMGEWKRQSNGAVESRVGHGVRCMVPVVVIGNYQVNAKFTRLKGDDGIGLWFPVGDRNSLIGVDNYNGLFAGICVSNGGDPKVDLANAFRQPRPFANEVVHEMQVVVSQRGESVDIKESMDGVQIYTWSGLESQLTFPSSVSNPNPHLIGFGAWGSIVSFSSLELRLNKGGRGYRLGDDWKNPLMVVTDRPSKEVAKKYPLLDWNGKKYLISDKPMPLPDVQRLATQVKGRLLTISSKEEQDFIASTTMNSRHYWTAGWCAVDRVWRDERNRPIRFLKWAGQDQGLRI